MSDEGQGDESIGGEDPQHEQWVIQGFYRGLITASIGCVLLVILAGCTNPQDNGMVVTVHPYLSDRTSSSLETDTGILRIIQSERTDESPTISTTALYGAKHSNATWELPLFESNTTIDCEIHRLDSMGIWVIQTGHPTYPEGESIVITLPKTTQEPQTELVFDAESTGGPRGATGLLTFVINDEGERIARRLHHPYLRITQSDKRIWCFSEDNIDDSDGVTCVFGNADSPEQTITFGPDFGTYLQSATHILPDGDFIFSGLFDGSLTANDLEIATAGSPFRGKGKTAFVARYGPGPSLVSLTTVGPLSFQPFGGCLLTTTKNGTTLGVTQTHTKLKTDTIWDGTVTTPKSRLVVFEIDSNGRILWLRTLAEGIAYPWKLLVLPDETYLLQIGPAAGKPFRFFGESQNAEKKFHWVTFKRPVPNGEIATR
jgi:hypothetical protein